jgi:ketosteroid isomerase-like protein
MTGEANAETALQFLQAFWRGDVEAAAAFATPDAKFVFARSLPYPRECPLPEALRMIVDGLFGHFDPPGHFEVTVRHAVGSGDHVTVEYSAAGRLANGREYANDYVMAFAFREGKIAEQRAYTDTLHLTRLFGP